MKKYLLTLLAICLAVSACSAQESSASLSGSWKLNSFGPVDSPSPAVENTKAGITFNEDGTVTGSSGCNGFGGNYTVDGDQVTFSEIVSTLMLCELIVGQEEAVFQVLTDTASFNIEGNTLTLTNNDKVLVFSR